MSYQVLARKWRPQDFSSLVGQGPIVTALRNALREGRIAQAYLFSGIRGVGKTTAARVLAKALNCERGPAPDPCNECSPCLEITKGSDLDVIEVDAATYSKVEQVRELTESLKYGPARDRYKVVVLDEVHRLSRQAFDALLKIVEEPPPHLVFIFATTEIEAVPATILSRCQEFQFRRVPSQEVAALLRGICESEEITASDAALRLVARAGEGSVRDAVALLDQLATFGSGHVADEDAVRLLGGLDTALFAHLLTSMLRGEPAAVAEVVRRIEEQGWDPRHVYGQFLAFARDALHLAIGGDPGAVDLPAEEAAALAATAREAGYENLLRLLQQLLASEQVVRRSESGALAVEIAWLRAAELPKLVRVEELLAGTRPLSGGISGIAGSPALPARTARSAAPAPVRAAAAGPKRVEDEDDPEPRPASRAAAPRPEPRPVDPSPAGARPAGASPPAARPTDTSPASARPAGPPIEPHPEPQGTHLAPGELRPSPPRPAPAAPAATPGTESAYSPGGDEVSSASSAGSEGEDAARIEAFKHEVEKTKPSLRGHLDHAQRLVFADGRLAIVSRPGDGLLLAAVQRESNRRAIEQAVVAVWGEGASWSLVEGSRAEEAPAPVEIQSVKLELVEDLEPVQTILKIFEGSRVEKVEEHGSTRED